MSCTAAPEPGAMRSSPCDPISCPAGFVVLPKRWSSSVLMRGRSGHNASWHTTTDRTRPLLLAAQPKLETPVLQVVHRLITRHLLGHAGVKAHEVASGAVTLIQRFGSAANINVHLHCLVLDGGYRRSADGAPEFVEAPGRGSYAQTVAGGGLYLPYRLRSACGPEGADGARRHAKREGIQAGPVRRHAGFQPARGSALRRR